jgi:hypothetical protein
MLHLFALSHSFLLFHINSCKHHQPTLPLIAAFKLHTTKEHKLQADERKNSQRTIIENDFLPVSPPGP